MNSEELDEEVGYHREVLDMAPHPDRHITLENLATALHTRFEWGRNTKDIEEAIELHREALAFRKPPHPDHGRSLNNLAIAVQTRFLQEGNTKDINEAIDLHRQRLVLCEPSHPDRGEPLNNLATALWT
ncbi:hypothetical protein K438DRAFT_1938944, partial [Mycena galopus ATCC 62051]